MNDKGLTALRPNAKIDSHLKGTKPGSYVTFTYSDKRSLTF